MFSQAILRRCLISLLLILLSACNPSEDQKELPNIDPNKKEIVFVTHNGPVTYYLNSEGQPAGIEYDLATLFMKEYAPDYAVRFVLVNSISDVIPTLLKGKGNPATAYFQQRDQQKT